MYTVLFGCDMSTQFYTNIWMWMWITPTYLPLTSPWFSSFHFHRCTMFNPVSIIRTFPVSKPPQYIFFNDWTDWFQSQLNSSLNSAFFFLSFKANPHIHLIMLISVLFIFTSCSIFISQVSLPHTKQLTPHIWCIYFDFQFQHKSFPG